MPKVLNRRFDTIPPDAIYVGRPSPFGNPFPMPRESFRDQVCDAYESIMSDPDNTLIPRIKAELKGKDLVCWCAPKRCHADTLLRIANEE